MAVPESIRNEIKLKAAQEWPGDYSMQLHVVNEQSEAFEIMVHYEASLDMTNVINLKSMKKAKSEWQNDFVMQLHVFTEQAEAAFAFFDFKPDAFPLEVVEEIRIRAFSEWPDDFVMMLHTLNEELESWQQLNA
jgi:hypothetical protein